MKQIARTTTKAQAVFHSCVFPHCLGQSPRAVSHDPRTSLPQDAKARSGARTCSGAAGREEGGRHLGFCLSSLTQPAEPVEMASGTWWRSAGTKTGVAVQRAWSLKKTKECHKMSTHSHQPGLNRRTVKPSKPSVASPNRC